MTRIHQGSACAMPLMLAFLKEGLLLMSEGHTPGFITYKVCEFDLSQFKPISSYVQ